MTPAFLSLRTSPRRLVAALALFVAATATCAQEVQEINRLLRAGQVAAASQKVDALLAKNPKDAQARFLKGVVLTEQGKSNDAIGVFQALTEDYPELPEPYNNIATLFAAKGQYEKAKTALEMAIQANQSYGVAYENLGDVYAKLASQAYDKALQLDRGNTTASGKLAAIRGAFGGKAAPAAPGTPKSEPPKSGALTGSATLVAGADPVKAVAVKASAPQAAAASMPASAGRADVLQAVDAWAAAWSARSLDTYLGSYSKAFAPEGRTRAEWEAARRASFPGSGPVQLTIEQPRVAMRSDAEAEVTFLQHYRSERARLDTRKTLRLEREDGSWRIAEERILN